MCTTHAHHNPEALPINLSTEAGSMGGIPTGGLRFGASHNAASHMPCASMIDFCEKLSSMLLTISHHLQPGCCQHHRFCWADHLISGAQA